MYNKEELKFYNMEKREKVVYNSVKRGNKIDVYEIEDKLSLEEKIAFIDELEDGLATYLLDILKKWEEEKDSLPKDMYDNPKTVSKKAWIKRNDPKNIIKTEYRIGHFHVFGTEYTEMSIECSTTGYGYNLLYTGQNIVHQWFHDLCEILYFEEKKYFESIDSKCIKLKEVKELGHRYGSFDIERLNDIVWNSKEDVSEAELDIYLNAFKKLERLQNAVCEEIKEQLREL